jgi:cbb3-type cytochrome oxidase maturation protein
MNIMFLLIGVSFLVAFIFLVLFIWAVKSGQYDDTFTPSMRILFDDDLVSADGKKDKSVLQVEEKPVTRPNK